MISMKPVYMYASGAEGSFTGVRISSTAGVGGLRLMMRFRVR